MKLKSVILIMLLCIGSVMSLFAWEERYTNLSIHSSWNSPVSDDFIDSSVSFGASYHFWGIFELTGSVYTTVKSGGDNIFGIESIDPIGLFSGGLGIKIPLGGISAIFDWQQLYDAGDAVQSLSETYKYGLSMDLNNRIGIEVYKRHFYNFSDEARAKLNLNSNDKREMIGAGIVLYI